ncbi:MAG TPA: NUDIX hydrolase [Thermoanaerobaculia bacterium]|nr:NUDIX hydrolase [Thermoanaerobaculia bacterium]
MILLRDAPLQILMILRHEKSSFVPSAWVFPGGAIDPEDGQPETLEAARAAAVRELFEETSIRVDGELVLTSRWITPAGLPKRFDTFFFLAIAPEDAQVVLHEAEAVDSMWIAPKAALERNRRGELRMVFPTVKNLEAIAGATSAAELLASRRGATIEPVEPIMLNNQPVLP